MLYHGYTAISREDEERWIYESAHFANFLMEGEIEMSNEVAKGPGNGAVACVSPQTSRFLEKVQKAKNALKPVKLMLGFDATASRYEGWKAAISMQADLAKFYLEIGEVPPRMRVTYFRGGDEFNASGWMNDAKAIEEWMSGVTCKSGATQIARTLQDAITQAEQGKIAALLYVGDAMEESPDVLLALARRLGELNVPICIFQEGKDPIAGRTFGEMAKASGGRHVDFEPGNFAEMKDLATVAVAWASGSQTALQKVRNNPRLSQAAEKLCFPTL